MGLDDDTYLDTSSHSIGEIKLVVTRTTPPKEVEEKRTTKVAPLPSQKIHETSKKGIAHRVRYVASSLAFYNNA
jgi:hypothetical protein